LHVAALALLWLVVVRLIHGRAGDRGSCDPHRRPGAPTRTTRENATATELAATAMMTLDGVVVGDAAHAFA
jgi:hypothetical protein